MAGADVVTIGVYGWTPERFFRALTDAGVVTLCDIRRRRGVRGAEYAFANRVRLEGRLADIGIEYTHRLDLAPGEGLRRVQADRDAESGTRKRERTQLDADFVAAFTGECLDGFDPRAFLDILAGPVCLLCVERDPSACHRTLVAARLADSGAVVRHLVP